MKFKIEPYKWQHKAIDMSKNLKDMALLAEMGTGKTGALINILRVKFANEQKVKPTLILAPLITLFNWRDEILKHSYMRQDDVVVLHKGGSVGKLKLFEREIARNPERIVVVNYEALLSDKLFESIMAWGPEILVCDEAHYCKNHKAKRSKKVAKIGAQTDHNYILTGTPVLNNVADIFMQYQVLDGGQTFGKSYTVFQRFFMEDVNAVWKARAEAGKYFPNWQAREDKYDELQEKIYTKAIRVLKKDCLDLPPLIKKVVKVELSKGQKKYYDEMVRDFLTVIEEDKKKGVAVAQLAVTRALRLQQIVTGFIKTEDDGIIEIADNPRLKAVKELLSALHVKHKVILWCSFIHNYKQLSELCTEMGIEHVMLVGGMSLEEKQRSMDDFNNNEDTRVIIANRRAGGIGVNLIAAKYSIVYSRNFSLEEELQSEARNYRGGSEIHDSVIKIDICAVGTVDERTTEALGNKQSVSERVIDLVKESL